MGRALRMFQNWFSRFVCWWFARHNTITMVNNGYFGVKGYGNHKRIICIRCGKEF